MSVSLIISYYNSTEFIKLLEIVPHHWTIFIYNKSNKPLSLSLPSTNLKIINLENKGRETDTYLNHIIFNYYDLYDYNIFIQDDTHNHIQDYHAFIQFANNFFNSKNTFIQYPAKYRKGTTQPQQRTIHSGIHSSNIHIPKDSILTTASLFNIPLPNSYTTYLCAHFISTSLSIRKHNIEFYMKLLYWANNSHTYSPNIKGYIFEHLWPIIFN
jgi:hypothetical protein